MEFFRKHQRPALLALLSLSLLFGGCASGGIFGGDDDDTYDDGDYDRDRDADRNDDYDRDDDRISEVRGRVDRVDTGNEIIYVEASDVYRSDLRNDDGSIPIYYDDQTEVEYEGRTYAPRALDNGFGILAVPQSAENKALRRECLREQHILPASLQGGNGLLDSVFCKFVLFTAYSKLRNGLIDLCSANLVPKLFEKTTSTG